MKRLDRGAGNVAPKRRLLLKGGVSALLAGVLPSVGAAESRHLLPGQFFTGSRIIQRATESGFPDLRTGGMAAPVPFVFPVAVAVSPMRDIYVADAGQNALFRLDPMMDAMNLIRGVRVTQQTRIAVASDGTLVVANGSAVPVVRVGRSGRVLQTIDGQLGGGVFYDELAVDAASGRYYGLDKVQRRLEEIMPHGRGGILLPQGLIPDLPAAMAMDGPTLYVAGLACQCLAAIDTFGTRNMEIVAEDLGQTLAIAAGDGWLAQIDGRDRVLRLWHQGALLTESGFAGLGLMDPRGLSIAQQMLYVADGAGRRVVSFRLRP